MKNDTSKYLLLSITLLGIFLNACKTDYTNQKNYNVKIGETTPIYYSTNSCCHYCLDQNKIKYNTLVDNKTLDTGPSDCDGCNYTAAYFFKAIAAGTDTIKLRLQGGGESCDSNVAFSSEIYIINVLP